MSKLHISGRVLVLTLLTGAACAHGKKDDAASQKVLDQAAFDLKCDRTALQISKISDDHQFMGVENATWGVTGCDRQATYKSSCGLGNCQIMSDASLTQAR